MSESSPSSSSGLLDYSQLEPFIEIGFEDFRDILDGMLLEVPDLLAQLDVSMAAGDATAGRAQAHSLRGMLLNFGCSALAGRLQDVERCGDFPGGDPGALSAELASLWTRTRAELERWTASQEGSV